MLSWDAAESRDLWPLPPKGEVYVTHVGTGFRPCSLTHVAGTISGTVKIAPLLI